MKKKLTLSRETIRKLSVSHLEHVRGGTFQCTDPCPLETLAKCPSRNCTLYETRCSVGTCGDTRCYSCSGC